MEKVEIPAEIAKKVEKDLTEFSTRYNLYGRDYDKKRELVKHKRFPLTDEDQMIPDLSACNLPKKLRKQINTSYYPH